MLISVGHESDGVRRYPVVTISLIVINIIDYDFHSEWLSRAQRNNPSPSLACG